VSTRRARTAVCTLAAATTVLVGMGWTPAGAAVRAANATRAQSPAPALTLVDQTSSVTTAQPGFSISLAIGPSAGPASGLHVSLTFYSRLDDFSQLQQATSGTPQTSVLLRVPDVAVTPGESSGGGTATACVSVLPNRAAASSSATAACPSPGSTLYLNCTPGTGTCGDVYPVSVALVRESSSTPVARFTTFLTYQEPGEPGSIGNGGPLRVGVVVPVSGAGVGAVASALDGHRDVATTLAVSPATVIAIEQQRARSASRALATLATVDSAEVVNESFVPVNVAALSEAGLTGEIDAQLSRGDSILRTAGLHPDGGPWVDTASTFSQGDASDLAMGVQATGAPQLVINDDALASGGLANYTFAQPFTLDLGHGSTVLTAAADSTLSARFTALPRNPVLGAEQLLAGLAFVHFENASLSQRRGVVVSPPPGWRASAPFLNTLLAGLSDNPALTAVTLSQLFAEVPVGGNREPSVRRLQAGPAGRGISRGAAQKIALGRQQLSSYAAAIPANSAQTCTAPDGHASEMTALNDGLLGTEARGLNTAGRNVALTAYNRAFAAETGKISLGTERTVTFTAQRAPIPITVLSAASYPVCVVVTLASDKFSFPDGDTRVLLLDRPTTSVRVTAQARTSGDRLPIDVSLRTPDGQLLITRTVLTVHSTAISFVGVALTVFAGAVLVVWWIRTWRRSRRNRLRAH
jgi:hypothetical protein